MLKPAIGRLLEETNCPYSLVIAIAKRARDIVSESAEKGQKLPDKPVNLAIDEFGDYKTRVKG